MRKWLSSNTILDEIGIEDYFECDIDVVRVDPSYIVGLSLPYERVVSDEYMDSLKRKVHEHGWNDPQPYGLSLYLLPDDTLIVVHGGNHRAVLSNELGLREIQASVTVLIHSSQVPTDILDKHYKLDAKRTGILARLHNTKRDENRWPIYDEITAVDTEINSILKALGLSKISESKCVWV